MKPDYKWQLLSNKSTTEIKQLQASWLSLQEIHTISFGYNAIWN